MIQDDRRTPWRFALLIPISMLFGVVGMFLVGENTRRPLLALSWGILGIPLVMAVMDRLFEALVRWRFVRGLSSVFLCTWFLCIAANAAAITVIRLLLG